MKRILSTFLLSISLLIPNISGATINWANNAMSLIADSGGITSGATSVTVTTGEGDKFPAVASPHYFMITFVDISGNREIVKVTTRTAGSNTMTIVRAQEGTSAQAFAEGSYVDQRITAGSLDEFSRVVDFYENVYLCDASAADQADTVNSLSLASLTGDIGTSLNATIILPHSGTGSTTPYNVLQALDLSLYDNITYIIERGAVITHGANTIEMSLPQSGIYQIFSGTGLVTFNQVNGGVVYPQLFGAVGDGVTVDTNPIQYAINAVNASGGGTVFFPRGKYKVTALTWKKSVHLIGEGGMSATTDEGTWIIGTTGSDILTMDWPTGQINNLVMRNIGFSGGDRQLVSHEISVWVFVSECKFSGPVEECISVKGFIQQWFFNKVDMIGGKYGFRVQNIAGSLSGQSPLMDKCTFTDVRASGQTENGWRIETTSSNSCTWNNPVVNLVTKHGFYADGGIVNWLFNNYNNERNHYGGGAIVDTGSITAGLNALTVTKTTFSDADNITVEGAGTNGLDLDTVVASGGGTVNLVLVDNASTTVSSVDVTNAIYDNFHVNNSIAAAQSITFISWFGSSGQGGDHVRYDINLIGVTNSVIMASRLSRDLYDSAGYISAFHLKDSNGGIRQPAETSLPYLYNVLSQNADANRLSSPKGNNLILQLADSNANGTGTYGAVEIRKYDATRSLMAQFPAAVAQFTNTDATPSVAEGFIFKTQGTTAITDFDGGHVGQTIRILATANIVITDSASIILAGGGNYNMTDSDTLTLTMVNDTVWQEMARSVN